MVIVTMMVMMIVVVMRMVMPMVVTCVANVVEENQTDQIDDQSSHQPIFADIGRLSNSLDCLQCHAPPNKHEENTINIA